jgi:hypothetical protein
MNFSRQPNNLNPVDILIQNMKQQQIKQEIDQQYKLLSSQMVQEASQSIKELREKKQKDKQNNNDTLLQQLVNQGLAKVKPGRQSPIKVSNKKGRKKLEDEITKTEYFKLSIDDQIKYDRKMATLYAKKGLGAYRSFKRQAPVNVNKKQRVLFNNYSDSLFPSYT